MQFEDMPHKCTLEARSGVSARLSLVWSATYARSERLWFLPSRPSDRLPVYTYLLGSQLSTLLYLCIPRDRKGRCSRVRKHVSRPLSFHARVAKCPVSHPANPRTPPVARKWLSLVGCWCLRGRLPLSGYWRGESQDGVGSKNNPLPALACRNRSAIWHLDVSPFLLLAASCPTFCWMTGCPTILGRGVRVLRNYWVLFSETNHRSS